MLIIENNSTLGIMLYKGWRWSYHFLKGIWKIFFWFYLDLAPDVQKSNSFYSTHTNATEDGGLMHSSVSVGGHTTEGHDGGEDDEEGVKGKMIVNVSSPV